MAADIRGGEGLVKPWVQECADTIQSTIPAVNSFGTYPGHDPDLTLAMDVFVPVFSLEPGTSVCNFLIPRFKQFSIWYIIFRQRIYNPEIGDYWRNMEDRGSPTQNHMDHVHISFYDKQPTEVDDMFSDDDRTTLTGIDGVINDPNIGLMRRVADIESGIQNIFRTFDEVKAMINVLIPKQPPQTPSSSS